MAHQYLDGITNVVILWDDADGHYSAGQTLTGKIEVTVKEVNDTEAEAQPLLFVLLFVALVVVCIASPPARSYPAPAHGRKRKCTHKPWRKSWCWCGRKHGRVFVRLSWDDYPVRVQYKDICNAGAAPGKGHHRNGG